MSRVSDAFRRAAEEGGQVTSVSAEQYVIRPSKNGDIDLKLKRQFSADAEYKEQADRGSKRQKHVDNINGANISYKQIDEHRRPTVLGGSGSVRRESTLRCWIDQALFGRNLHRVVPHPLVALEKNSYAGEQYKILREQINKMTNVRARRIIAVTSPIKGDGKTTVAANLATAMALHREAQILLVDADLRSPSIHRYFGVNPSPGLADYLSSAVDGEFMDYVKGTSIPGLRVLTAGKGTSHSAELLASERMKSLIEKIAARFSNDQVVVDTSPVLSTSDPLVLSRQLDGLLMVVRAGKTPRACLSEAIKLLGADKIMGLILNGAELGRSARYYYYYGQTS